MPSRQLTVTALEVVLDRNEIVHRVGKGVSVNIIQGLASKGLRGLGSWFLNLKWDMRSGFALFGVPALLQKKLI